MIVLFTLSTSIRMIHVCVNIYHKVYIYIQYIQTNAEKTDEFHVILEGPQFGSTPTPYKLVIQQIVK